MIKTLIDSQSFLFTQIRSNFGAFTEAKNLNFTLKKSLNSTQCTVFCITPTPHPKRSFENIA